MRLVLTALLLFVLWKLAMGGHFRLAVVLALLVGIAVSYFGRQEPSPTPEPDSDDT